MRWPASAGAGLTTSFTGTWPEPTVQGNLLATSPHTGATWRTTSSHRPRGATATSTCASELAPPAAATHTQQVTGQLRAHTHTAGERTMLDSHSTTRVTVNFAPTMLHRREPLRPGGQTRPPNRTDSSCWSPAPPAGVQHLHHKKPQPTHREPPWPHRRLLEVMCILVPASVWALAVA